MLNVMVGQRCSIIPCQQTCNGACVMQQLPEFPPPEGHTRAMGFKRVLLNTCQEEFEGAAAARQVSCCCAQDTNLLHVQRAVVVQHSVCRLSSTGNLWHLILSWSSIVILLVSPLKL